MESYVYLKVVFLFLVERNHPLNLVDTFLMPYTRSELIHIGVAWGLHFVSSLSILDNELVVLLKPACLAFLNLIIQFCFDISRSIVFVIDLSHLLSFQW